LNTFNASASIVSRFTSVGSSPRIASTWASIASYNALVSPLGDEVPLGAEVGADAEAVGAGDADG
jgi:hypothetical protein